MQTNQSRWERMHAHPSAIVPAFIPRTPFLLDRIHSPHPLLSRPHRQTKICARYCATIPGAIYFGVEYAHECFCGDDATAETGFQKYGLADGGEFKCDYLCTDGGGETCGGFQTIEASSFVLSGSCFEEKTLFVGSCL